MVKFFLLVKKALTDPLDQDVWQITVQIDITFLGIDQSGRCSAGSGAAAVLFLVPALVPVEAYGQRQTMTRRLIVQRILALRSNHKPVAATDAPLAEVQVRNSLSFRCPGDQAIPIDGTPNRPDGRPDQTTAKPSHPP